MTAPTPQPEWLETIPNDGTYEYTMSADCDGGDVRYFRRTPRYVTPAGEFTEITAQQFEAVASEATA